jgi:hypothetical protein
MSDQTSIADTKKSLNKAVGMVKETAGSENQQDNDSIKFLEKFSSLSMSAYSYIDSDIEEAKTFFLLAKDVDVNIPDNFMGDRFKELEKIMNYLLNVIEK